MFRNPPALTGSLALLVSSSAMLDTLGTTNSSGRSSTILSRNSTKRAAETKWQLKIADELNGQEKKLVKVRGDIPAAPPR